MAEEERVAPVSFEIVNGKGIHPFYLGMTIDQIFESASGWKITSTERDNALDVLTIILRVGSKQMEIGTINVRASVPDAKSHYQLYDISTRDALLSDGRYVSKMKHKDILNDILFKYHIFPTNTIFSNDEENASYESKDGCTYIHFSESDRPLLQISRVPPLGD
jgi:hypothetical protein